MNYDGKHTFLSTFTCAITYHKRLCSFLPNSHPKHPKRAFVDTDIQQWSLRQIPNDFATSTAALRYQHKTYRIPRARQ